MPTRKGTSATLPRIPARAGIDFPTRGLLRTPLERGSRRASGALRAAARVRCWRRSRRRRGCSTSAAARAGSRGELAAAGFDVVGVDVAQEPLRRARERFGELEFLLVGERELPFASGSFDGVWLGEVLEHVQDGLGLLAELARVLVPGGRLALSTPDHGRRCGCASA